MSATLPSDEGTASSPLAQRAPLPEPTMQVLAEVRRALHDLAQPMTALQCGLFLGSLEQDDVEQMRLTIARGLTECNRMIERAQRLGEQINHLERDGGAA